MYGSAQQDSTINKKVLIKRVGTRRRKAEHHPMMLALLCARSRHYTYPRGLLKYIYEKTANLSRPIFFRSVGHYLVGSKNASTTRRKLQPRFLGTKKTLEKRMITSTYIQSSFRGFGTKAEGSKKGQLRAQLP